MYFLKKIFYVNTLNRPWYKIIAWWELRRILYNVILILFGYISYQLSSFLPSTGYFKLYSGPALAVWALASVIIFFVAANLCYTSGWIFQLLANKLNGKLIKIITARLFIFGLIISLLVTLIPFILEILNIVLPKKLLEMVNSLIVCVFNLITS